MNKEKEIHPLNDMVYVTPIIEREDKSGLTRADVAIEKPNKGIVKYSGPEASVQDGDTVIFNKYAPDEVELNGEKLLQMTQKDIYAILK